MRRNSNRSIPKLSKASKNVRKLSKNMASYPKDQLQPSMHIREERNLLNLVAILLSLQSHQGKNEKLQYLHEATTHQLNAVQVLEAKDHR